ncbi:MAG: hypothetical protein AB7O78_09890 [Thermoleophilia bacterium]
MTWRARSLPALAAGCLGLCAVLPGQAVAQLPLCTNDADALETNAAAVRPVIGAAAAVVVSLKDGRQAPVSALTVTVSPGGPPQPLATPLPGTESRLDFVLGAAPRTTVTITWDQGDEPGIAVSCAGRDAYVLKTGPSAAQVRTLIRGAAFAQIMWFQRAKAGNALVDRLQARLRNSGDPAVVFPSLRAAARSALMEMPAVRRFSKRYAVRVAGIVAPAPLKTKTRALGRTATRGDAALTAYLTALSQAETLSDVTVAGRAFDGASDRANQPRIDWRKAVVAAAKDAGVAVPAWLNRVGR